VGEYKIQKLMANNNLSSLDRAEQQIDASSDNNNFTQSKPPDNNLASAHLAPVKPVKQMSKKAIGILLVTPFVLYIVTFFLLHS